ncbi:septal ring lytic transglycosylase RlpA family protein [Rhodohalobacter sp. 8-1]|uniref:septal ring lytic transglycosylase RlpA family protein n=1 Tax=Rhodohalobacter sp. 8-1 TaxID=3131972 RepID=UPI0030EBB18B
MTNIPSNNKRKSISSDYLLILVLMLMTMIFQSCGIVRVGSVRSPSVSSTSSADEGRILQSGVASWYGPNFHGKATANGETFNMNDFTAAHRTLPFNTIVQVLNNDNGQSVRVRINDRGPYVDDRIIDLSRRAAREIEMEDTGTANVQIILLEEGDRPVASGLVTNQETFTIQLASYNTEAEALAFARRTNGTRVEQVTLSGRQVYRVYYGTYDTAIDARDDQRRLARQGLDGFVKQAEN